MRINKEDLNRHIWYEDSDGNIYEFRDRVPPKEEVKGMTYHTMFPLEITEHIYAVDEKSGEYKFLADMNTHIGKGNEEVITAMVNSGDYTISEAIILWARSCERCMNVLAYKYLNGKDGYPEHSYEWNKCNTSCKFCEEKRRWFQYD